jgi:hypothetical protein
VSGKRGTKQHKMPHKTVESAVAPPVVAGQTSDRGTSER